jgi:hypothetical protein
VPHPRDQYADLLRIRFIQGARDTHFAEMLRRQLSFLPMFALVDMVACARPAAAD